MLSSLLLPLYLPPFFSLSLSLHSALPVSLSLPLLTSILNQDGEARILVQSEEDPQRMLLETKITRDDGYQKQQDTLIVWTEHTGVDMALSFQEGDACSQIWSVALRHLLPDPPMPSLSCNQRVYTYADAQPQGLCK